MVRFRLFSKRHLSPVQRGGLAGLAALLLGGMLLTLVHWGVGRFTQTRLDLLTQSAQTAAEAVHNRLNDAMMKNDRATIQTIVGAARDIRGITRILVIGPHGHVYVDSTTQWRGSTVDFTVPGCVECHQYPAEAIPPATGLVFLPDQIRVARPVPKENRCASCHVDPSNKLGVVLVDVSRADIDAQARAYTGWGLALALIVSLGAGAALWRWLPAAPGAADPVPAARRLIQWPRLRPWPTWTRWAMGTVVMGLAAFAVGGLTAAQAENNSAFCASCHTEPETTFYGRSLNPPSDLASLHAPEAVACIGCHSGTGVTGRIQAIVDGAVNSAVFFSSTTHRSAIMQNTLSDTNCVKCHARDLQQSGAAHHYHRFLARWQELAPARVGACVTCHPAHHLNDRADRAFVSDAATQPECAACHAAARGHTPAQPTQ